jgi:RND family efflux transporter MFP subunit
LAKVNVDAFGEQTFTARVSRISPVLDAATRSGMVEVEIPNVNGHLKAEMFARVTLDLSSTRMATVIPREALVYRGQQPGVYLVQDRRPVFKPIETGLSQGDKVEVLAELTPGMIIVTRGATMIAEGDQIRVVGGDGPARGKPVSGDPTDRKTRVARNGE